MEAATVALWAFADPQCDELHGTQTSVATAKIRSSIRSRSRACYVDGLLIMTTVFWVYNKYVDDADYVGFYPRPS